MARRLRPVGPDFVGTAPVRLVFGREAAASPEQVFHALAADVAGWPRWFAAVTSARATGGGAGREIRLRGGTRFAETVLVAKEPEVYAYRVDVTDAPGVRALVKEWRPAPQGTGTRVRWTVAADGPAPFRTALGPARPGVGQAFRNAVRSLDRQLARH
ncbi:SRPBCC family protein [Streptomyces sp. NPDC038707]|uniref:SRPBCC family protein n=1 Tax=Streptomyces sp. NPDC038707 TaxID=3154329 RepID=UPI0033DCADBC